MSTQNLKTVIILIIATVLSFAAGIVVSNKKNGNTDDGISQNREETKLHLEFADQVNSQIEKKVESLNFTFDDGYSIQVQ